MGLGSGLGSGLEGEVTLGLEGEVTLGIEGEVTLGLEGGVTLGEVEAAPCKGWPCPPAPARPPAHPPPAPLDRCRTRAPTLPALASSSMMAGRPTQGG